MDCFTAYPSVSSLIVNLISGTLHQRLQGPSMVNWVSAGRGIRYREHPTRKHRQRPDRYWRIRYSWLRTTAALRTVKSSISHLNTWLKPLGKYAPGGNHQCRSGTAGRPTHVGQRFGPGSIERASGSFSAICIAASFIF